MNQFNQFPGGKMPNFLQKQQRFLSRKETLARRRKARVFMWIVLPISWSIAYFLDFNMWRPGWYVLLALSAFWALDFGNTAFSTMIPLTTARWMPFRVKFCHFVTSTWYAYTKPESVMMTMKRVFGTTTNYDRSVRIWYNAHDLPEIHGELRNLIPSNLSLAENLIRTTRHTKQLVAEAIKQLRADAEKHHCLKQVNLLLAEGNRTDAEKLVGTARTILHDALGLGIEKDVIKLIKNQSVRAARAFVNETRVIQARESILDAYKPKINQAKPEHRAKLRDLWEQLARRAYGSREWRKALYALEKELENVT